MRNAAVAQLGTHTGRLPKQHLLQHILDPVIHLHIVARTGQCVEERILTLDIAQRLGFVFQFYNLVANLTAKENVELASEIMKDAQEPTQALIDVGLQDRINNFPAQLSGGEQQRVAIARAVAKNPKILLCDEPTGALDYNTGKQVLQILQDQSRKKGATVVIVTHNSAIAPIADRVIHMHDARVKSIEVNEHPMDIKDLEW